MQNNIPRPEYPRPQFVRDAWANLNGVWRFAFDAEGKGEHSGWHETGRLDKQITVPFVHQCPLSGIGETAQVDYVWYAREFEIPAEWLSGRLLLHFGAVDYQTDVWVNGRHAGGHAGGYTPFALDITELAHAGGNLLTVRAFDPISPEIPSGKQSFKESHGCLYTRSTGIWQTVWLEPVAAESLCPPEIFPSLQQECVRIIVPVRGGDGLTVRAETAGELAEATVEEGRAVLEIPVAAPDPWEPGNPHLYDLELSLLKNGQTVDKARSYFGMRDFQIDGTGFLLNGRPLVFRGVLDQGYWPDGLYTARSDEELRLDIERSMDYGFNSARLHQKVFDPRMLYWADRLGYPVWGEMADWGLDLALPAAQANFRREWDEAVRRDISHPSLLIWTPFNERSGAFHSDKAQHDFVREIVQRTKELDPSRPVCSSSGFEHVTETDIADIHDYDANAPAIRERYSQDFTPDGPPLTTHNVPTFAEGEHYTGQPVVASEIGGIWWAPELAGTDAWGYGGRPQNEEEFLRRYTDTVSAFITSPNLAGFVYTQLTDVEQEVNGLYTYDRKPKFTGEMMQLIRRVNQQPAPGEE